MAPHSSTLAWKIPWTEEPGRLQSTGLQSQTQLSDFTFYGLMDAKFTALIISQYVLSYYDVNLKLIQ